MKKLLLSVLSVMILTSVVRAESVTITWDDTANPPGTVATYTLHYRELANTTYRTATVLGNTMVITVTDLLPNTVYTLFVTAGNAGGESEPSAPILYSNVVKPKPPVNVRAKN